MGMPTRRSFRDPNIQLSYLQWTSDNPPVLLLHGLADHALVWSSLGDRLAENYHVVAPDLRGHGESFKPSTGYFFSDYIADLNALLDALGWSSVHVLGHSWGAKLAAIWASRQPERFRSLMLVDPFFIGTMPTWFKLTFPFLYRVLPFLKLVGTFSSYAEAEAIAHRLKQYRDWTELQQQVFQGSLEQQSDGRWRSKFVEQARDEIFFDVMQVSGLTHPLEMPCLFIQPQKGLNRFEFQFKPYRRFLNNLQWQTVPGHHWAHLVEPEAFNQAIATFLQALP